MSRRIGFLCEFGGVKGWGHLIRCVAVAEEAKSRGWRTTLIGNGSFQALSNEAKNAFDSIHCECDWIKKIPEDILDCDILFVDEMYESDVSLERVRKYFYAGSRGGRLIVATDDMQKRRMEWADLVVNSEIRLSEADYDPCVRSLLGDRYSMLRRPFGKAYSTARFQGKWNVFIMLGGTDPFGNALKVLEALDRDCCIPHLVTGEYCSIESTLKALMAEFEESSLYHSLSASEIAECITRCHYGIIACGTSAFELGALRLPFVGLSVVDNQTATAKKIEKSWGMPIVRCEEGGLSSDEIRARFDGLVKCFPGDRSTKYCDVDGLGCSRILDACESALAKL